MAVLDRVSRGDASAPSQHELWQAAQGLVDMLAETSLSLDQKHYVDSLRRLIVSGLSAGAAVQRAAGGGTGGPAVTPAARPEVDMDVLRELRSFLPEPAFRELTQQFESNVRRLRDDLIRAVAGRDIMAVEFAAHAMIGAVGAFGLRRLASESRRAVTAAREKRTDEAFDTVTLFLPQIEPALAAVNEAIEKIITHG